MDIIVITFSLLIAAGAALWLALKKGWIWDFQRFRQHHERVRLSPESRFNVVVDGAEIVSHRPDGTIERVALAAVKEIFVVTTSDGPWAPDVWWLLLGAGSCVGCSFPSGATGEQYILALVQKLPGFDNQAVIAAMGSTADRKFLCWRGDITAAEVDGLIRSVGSTS